jgi:hypothetical protein
MHRHTDDARKFGHALRKEFGGLEEESLLRRAAGELSYGGEEGVQISLGEQAFYKVIGDGKGGCTLREEPSYTSTECPYEAQLGATVRVSQALRSSPSYVPPFVTRPDIGPDQVLQLPGGRLRAYICEPADQAGWASVQMLECQSGSCGHCCQCDTAVLPSVVADMSRRKMHILQKSELKVPLPPRRTQSDL